MTLGAGTEHTERAGHGFDGFRPGTVSFLEGLRENNNKVWFQSHKADYERFVLEPMRAFAEDMAERLTTLAGPAGGGISGTPFRIYRDVRFSKDKSPYKTHLGVPFGRADRRHTEGPGFYFHLEPPTVMLGGGMYGFTPAALSKYRDAVVDAREGEALRELVDGAIRDGYELWGKGYKRVPRGYDPDHPNADLLLYRGLFAGLTVAVPEELFSSALLDWCEAHYRATHPLEAWLERVVMG
jgi:uncharacterized protein (TIGR02453 family)